MALSSRRAGCRGRSPPPGVQRVPLYWKTSEGGAGGIAAQAKTDHPLKEGAGQNKTIRPGRARETQDSRPAMAQPVFINLLWMWPDKATVLPAKAGNPAR